MTDLRLTIAQAHQQALRAEAHAERLTRPERDPESRSIGLPFAAIGALIGALAANALPALAALTWGG